MFVIHGTTNGRSLAFGPHLRSLARVHESLTVHIRFSRRDAGVRLGETHDSVGRVDLALLKSELPYDGHDFYLCGPASVLKHDRAARPGPIAEGLVLVRFSVSGVEAEWSPSKGTLLELAETADLNPDFGRRSGICGTCATRITCGTVDYVEEPVGLRADGEVLICCATPRSSAGRETCGSSPGVVLDL